MKLPAKILLPLLLVLMAAGVKAQHTVKKLWETDTTLRIPESVLPVGNVLYVSLIDGEAWGADGKGEVGQLSRTGKIINPSWITGLNAPKGLAKYGDLLYVADLDELVVIRISKNKIDHKIKIKGAANLNDVTVDKSGVVYVSDTKQACVFRVKNGTAALYLDNLKGANGVKAIGDKLYVLTGDGMYVAGPDKKLSKIGVLEHGGDGIEPIGNGDFVVTAWEGYLYYVQANGTKTVMLDTHATQKRTADIGYDPQTRTIYVPTFLGKSVVAYHLK